MSFKSSRIKCGACIVAPHNRRRRVKGCTSRTLSGKSRDAEEGLTAAGSITQCRIPHESRLRTCRLVQAVRVANRLVTRIAQSPLESFAAELRRALLGRIDRHGALTNHSLERSITTNQSIDVSGVQDEGNVRSRGLQAAQNRISNVSVHAGTDNWRRAT